MHLFLPPSFSFLTCRLLLSRVVACCHLYPLVIACSLLPRAFAWCRLLSLGVACCRSWPLLPLVVSGRLLPRCRLPLGVTWCRLLPLGVICFRFLLVVAFCLLSLAAGKCLSLVVACRLLLLLVSTRNSLHSRLTSPSFQCLWSLISCISSHIFYLSSLLTSHSSVFSFVLSFSSLISVLSPVVFLLSSLASFYMHCCKSSERLCLKCKFSLASATNIFLVLDFKSPCIHENINFVSNKEIT